MSRLRCHLALLASQDDFSAGQRELQRFRQPRGASGVRKGHKGVELLQLG